MLNSKVFWLIIVLGFFTGLFLSSKSHGAGWVPGHWLPDGRFEPGYYDFDHTHPNWATLNADPRMKLPDNREVIYRHPESEPTDHRRVYNQEMDPRLRNARRRDPEDTGIGFRRIDPSGYDHGAPALHEPEID